jgi:hypothetical protein
MQLPSMLTEIPRLAGATGDFAPDDVVARQQRRVERIADVAQRYHFVALFAPACQQSLQGVAELEALEFGVQRENMVAFPGSGGRRFGQAQQVEVHVFRAQVVRADQFVQGRQRRRQLRAGDDLPVPYRDEWMGSSAVGRPSIA